MKAGSHEVEVSMRLNEHTMVIMMCVARVTMMTQWNLVETASSRFGKVMFDS